MDGWDMDMDRYGYGHGYGAEGRLLSVSFAILAWASAGTSKGFLSISVVFLAALPSLLHGRI